MKAICLKLAALICALAIILPLSAVTAFAEEGDTSPASPADGVSEVTLASGGDKINVSINLSKQYISEHKRATVYLFELSPSDSEQNLSRLSPVDTYTVSTRHTYKCDRTEGSLDRIYCSYLLAASDGKGGYLPLGERKYIQNPELLSQNSTPLPAARTVKGLCVTSLTDALSLNISNALLEVDLSTLFADSPSRDTLSRDIGGVTYYFSLPALEVLDDKVKTLSDAGIVVYIRLSLGTHPSSLPYFLSSLGFENAAEGAEGFAFNTYSRSGAELLTAALELIFDRYTAEGAPHGFCGSYILGDRVNLPSLHNAADGEMTADEYTALICSTLRLADTALRSRLEAGRIYISLANNYSALPVGTGISDSTASAFLTKLYSLSVSGGDFPWCIATSAFALDINDSTIWDDALATGASSQYTSPANINVISYEVSKNYLYNGAPRSLIVDRFAVSAADSEAGQAASIAFSYYKAISDGLPLAILYAAQTDSPDAVGVYGLSRSDASGNILTRRQSWTAFCELDSLSDSSISSLASNVGGVFEYMYSTLRDKAAILPRYSGSVTLGEARGVSLTSLFDFSSGDRQGFSLCGVGYPATPSLVRAADRSALSLSSVGGIAKSAPFPSRRLAGAETLTLSLSPVAEDCSLTLRLIASDGSCYEASASVPAGERQLSFNISDFTDRLDKGDITLMLYTKSGALSVLEISAGGAGQATSVIIIIMIVILVLFAIMIAVALFNSAFHAYRRRRSHSTSLARRDD